MKESTITMLLGICTLVLAFIVGVGIFVDDREAPVITLEGKNNITYVEGDSYDALLENIHAVDKKEGDVTETLCIYKFNVTSDNRAIVYYAAKDSSNNIGKLKREICYQAKNLH